jgi:hypothetical protein
MRTLLLPSPSGSAAPPTGHNSVATIQHVEASSETTNAFLGTYFRAGLYVSQFQYLAKATQPPPGEFERRVASTPERDDAWACGQTEVE